MKLSNEVLVPLDPDTLFELLQDVERIAPCLPGAKIEGREGEDYLGSAKVKVGPIAVAYQGRARFDSLDPVNRRAVLSGRGTELQGSGGAEATVDVQVVEHAAGSRLLLETELAIRGKVAQFGRGILGDVSQNLVQQFASNLAQLEAGGSAETGSPGTSHLDFETADSMNGLALVAGPMIKRYGATVAAFLVGVAAGMALGRLGRRP